MVFTEHKGKTLYGGVATPNLTKIKDGQWHMAAGSLIFVPLKSFIANETIQGWSLEDLVCNGGLDHNNWTEE